MKTTPEQSAWLALMKFDGHAIDSDGLWSPHQTNTIKGVKCFGFRCAYCEKAICMTCLEGHHMSCRKDGKR